MSHLYKTMGHVVAAVLVTLLLGAGAASSGILGLVAATAVVGAVTTVVGVFGLQMLRSMLGFAQMGKLFQLALFFALAALFFSGFAWVLPALLTVTNALLAAGSTVAAFLAVSLVTGNLAQYKNRSWLPVKGGGNGPRAGHGK